MCSSSEFCWLDHFHDSPLNILLFSCVQCITINITVNILNNGTLPLSTFISIIFWRSTVVNKDYVNIMINYYLLWCIGAIYFYPVIIYFTSMARAKVLLESFSTSPIDGSNLEPASTMTSSRDFFYIYFFLFNSFDYQMICNISSSPYILNKYISSSCIMSLYF